jgi:translation initiation factor IF-3
LVEVSPKANPPVAKILNFGQFKYQKEKEARKQKAQSKEIEVKGVRITFRIGEHDFQIRVNQALKFLERGDKVKVELMLRGREKGHMHLAVEQVEKFVAMLKETYPLRIEQPVTKQGNQVTAIVARA